MSEQMRIAYSDGTTEYCSPTNRQYRMTHRKALEDAGFEQVRIQDYDGNEWRDAS